MLILLATDPFDPLVSLARVRLPVAFQQAERRFLAESMWRFRTTEWETLRIKLEKLVKENVAWVYGAVTSSVGCGGPRQRAVALTD